MRRWRQRATSLLPTRTKQLQGKQNYTQHFRTTRIILKDVQLKPFDVCLLRAVWSGGWRHLHNFDRPQSSHPRALQYPWMPAMVRRTLVGGKFIWFSWRVTCTFTNASMDLRNEVTSVLHHTSFVALVFVTYRSIPADSLPQTNPVQSVSSWISSQLQSQFAF